MVTNKPRISSIVVNGVTIAPCDLGIRPAADVATDRTLRCVVTLAADTSAFLAAVRERAKATHRPPLVLHTTAYTDEDKHLLMAWLADETIEIANEPGWSVEFVGHDEPPTDQRLTANVWRLHPPKPME